MCFALAVGVANANFNLETVASKAGDCEPEFGVHIERDGGFVGGYNEISCSDGDFLEAINFAGISPAGVIGATYQVVAGTLYIPHVEVNGKFCRVAIYKKLDRTFEVLEDRTCCGAQLASQLKKC